MANEQISRMEKKKQLTRLEKIFACCVLNRELISKINKQLQKSNTMQTNHPVYKQTIKWKVLKRISTNDQKIFPSEKCKLKCIEVHLTHSEWPSSRKPVATDAVKDVKKDPYPLLMGKQTDMATMEVSMWFLKKTKNGTILRSS